VTMRFIRCSAWFGSVRIVALDFRRATINFKIYFYFHTRARKFFGDFRSVFEFFAASRQLPVLEKNFLGVKFVFRKKSRLQKYDSETKTKDFR